MQEINNISYMQIPPENFREGKILQLLHKASIVAIAKPKQRYYKKHTNTTHEQRCMILNMSVCSIYHSV